MRLTFRVALFAMALASRGQKEGRKGQKGTA